MMSIALHKSLPVLFALLIINAFTLIPLLSHQSEPAVWFGRYSNGYLLFLAGIGGINLLWGLGLVFRQLLQSRLATIPKRIYQIAIVFLTLALFTLWQLPIESQIQHTLALHGILLAGILVSQLDDRAVSSRLWRMVIILLLILLLIPLLITALTGMSFSPDEAHWADYATSLFVADGVYSRTWQQSPTPIHPGLPWSIVGYGWLLENVDFSLHIGRLWNFMGYALAIIGIGVVAHKLYGREVALMSVAMATLSQSFFPILDYRPDHQMPLALVLALVCLIRARERDRRWLWDMLAGLVVTLSLNLHASGMVFAVAFSLIYAVSFLWQITHKQPLRQALIPLIGFGVGAGIGTGIFLLINVAPVGGLSVYLSKLASQRFNIDRRIFLENVSLPSVMETVLIVWGFAYLIWRRNATDRFLLGVYSAVLVSALMVDSWGYRTLHIGIVMISIGVLVVDVVKRIDVSFSQRSLWFSGMVVVMFAGQITGQSIDWNAVSQVVQNGAIPAPVDVAIGKLVAENISEDDVLVSTHLLIWTFHDKSDFYTVSGERTAILAWREAQGLDMDADFTLDQAEAVWERLGVTVIADIENRMTLPDGLRAYMETQDFVLCWEEAVAGHRIRLYREQCP